MLRFFPLFSCLLFVTALGLPVSARADYYVYTNAGGTPVITNRLETVPMKYRKGMRVVKEEKQAVAGKEGRRPVADYSGKQSESVQTGLPAEQPSALVPTSPSVRLSGYLSRFPWLSPLAIVAVLLAGFLSVVKIAASLSSPHLARLVYLAFFFGVFVFAYKSYAEALVDNYFTVRKKIEAMFRKANVRQEGEMPETPQASGVPERERTGE